MAVSNEELSDLISTLAIQTSNAEGPTNPQNGGPTDDSKKSTPMSRTSSNDDLIPQSDPCYLNVRLRDRSVDLLRLVTARTVLRFVLSLIDGEECTQFYQRNTPNRESIIKSVQKNRECLASHSRSETQLIIGQYLLSTREEIIEKFEENVPTDDLEDEDSDDDQVSTLQTKLNEQNVSSLVEGKLTNLILNEFKTYSYRKDLDKDSPSSMAQFDPIDLVAVSKLMNFYGHVSYWNKFFDLIFSSSLPSV